MFIQKKESIFELGWSDKGVTYKDVCLKNEIEQSFYNFAFANVDFLKKQFSFAESEAKNLITEKLVYPSYEKCIKASHFFNLLDARGVLSVSERAEYIKRVRDIAKLCCEQYSLSLREKNV